MSFSKGQGTYRLSFVRRAIVITAMLSLLLVHAAAAQAALITKESPFSCDDDELGKVTVSYSDDVLGGLFAQDKEKTIWTINGGMNITAGATPNAKAVSEKLAWMQVVTEYQAGTEFQDRTSGKPLVAPWPDTPPGGYKITTDAWGRPRTNPKIQVFDDEPWYANLKPGNLVLRDSPRNGINPAVGSVVDNFETWLVCYIGKNDGTYSVVPLIGFTWGFTYAYDKDKNGNGIVGDQRDEYTTKTSFAGFVAGNVGPSQTFKDGYAKYFKINYVRDCTDCHKVAAPLPAALPMGLVCLMALGYRSYRSRHSAKRSA